MSFGLYKVPVSKSLLASICAASVAVTFPLRKLQPSLVYDYSGVFLRWEIWRVLLAKLTFTDPKDLICGLLLLYHFRIFERRYGSRKFASVLVATGFMGTLLELAILYVSKAYGIPHLTPFPTGPHVFIFPLFVSYFLEVPRVTFTHLLGVSVTGKSFTYLLGLQMACTSTQSMCAAVCGLLSGALYHLNIARIQSWLCVPRVVARVFDRLLGGLLDPSTSAPSFPPNMGATVELQQQQERDRLEERLIAAATAGAPSRGGPFRGAELAPGDMAADRYGQIRRRQQPPPLPASEEQIGQLVEMGFPRVRVLSALERTHNDLHRATSLLLQEQQERQQQM